MSDLTDEFGGGFVAIPNYAFDQNAISKIGAAAFAVYCVFLFRQNRKKGSKLFGMAYPSQQGIAEMTGQDVKTVRRHIATLERAGLVEVVRKGGRTSTGDPLKDNTMYRVRMIPRNMPDVPKVTQKGSLGGETPRSDGVEGGPKRDSNKNHLSITSLIQQELSTAAPQRAGGDSDDGAKESNNSREVREHFQLRYTERYGKPLAWKKQDTTHLAGLLRGCHHSRTMAKATIDNAFAEAQGTPHLTRSLAQSIRAVCVNLHGPSPTTLTSFPADALDPLNRVADHYGRVHARRFGQSWRGSEDDPAQAARLIAECDGDPVLARQTINNAFNQATQDMQLRHQLRDQGMRCINRHAHSTANGLVIV